MQKITCTIFILSFLAGCAEQQQVRTTHVSPQQFSKYNCNQIRKEMQYTSAQYEQLANQSQTGAVLNTALAAFAMTQNYAFSTGDNGEAQAAYLKSKYDALHQASIEKDCD